MRKLVPSGKDPWLTGLGRADRPAATTSRHHFHVVVTPSGQLTNDAGHHLGKAYECIHYLKRKKGKVGACVVKLDMAKAYDHVEWPYLQGIMLRLGFSENFVATMIRCVTSVSFSVRVNGQLSTPFFPTRGIPQGDLISPYLFLLCSEGLSCMLNSVGPVFLSRGVHVGVHAPQISHLLFADDSIVFTEASQRGAN